MALYLLMVGCLGMALPMDNVLATEARRSTRDTIFPSYFVPDAAWVDEATTATPPPILTTPSESVGNITTAVEYYGNKVEERTFSVCQFSLVGGASCIPRTANLTDTEMAELRVCSEQELKTLAKLRGGRLFPFFLPFILPSVIIAGAAAATTGSCMLVPF